MPDDRFLHRRAGRSNKVNLLTDVEFRVWVQYLLSADDFGVMRGTYHPLQNDNDHLATRPAKVIQRCLDAIVACGLIRRFEHQGKPYVYQHDWQSWQKVSYPRTTTQPAPPAAALKDCDEATQKLFNLHPGGAGQKRREHSGNVLETLQKYSPLMRAGTPAERLTAHGSRLTAHGSDGGAEGETIPPMDRWFEELKAAYPPQAVSSGHRTMTAFVDALMAASDGPGEAWRRMCANLTNQREGHQWRVKGMIPRLETWLRDGLWEQRHEAAPPAARVSEKTARTLTSAAAFVAGGDHESS